jgi:hypothetical protein
VTSPTVTYTTQDGYYVKTGKQVFVHARITINTYSGGSSSGLIRLNGLPFTSSSPSYSVLSVSRIGDWALDISTYTGPQWIVLSNLTSCYLYSVSNSTGSQDALAPDIFGNGSTFTFSGTYEAA